MKNRNINYLVAAILTGTMLTMAPSVYAQTPTPTHRINFFQGFVQYISQKFGLDKAKVQDAVTEFREQRKANITPRPSQTTQQIVDREKVRLNKLVAEGKITNDQETAILKELGVLRTKYGPESLKNLTPEERKTKIQARQDEILTWAKSTGIDSSYLMGRGFGFEGFGRGGIDRMGEKKWGGRI